MNDLKSQHAVEPNGIRHIVGGQCDSADALDHRDTLHMIPLVRAHRVCHRLSRYFKYDFSELYWWHFRPRAVKCAKSTAGHSLRIKRKRSAWLWECVAAAAVGAPSTPFT